MMRTHIIRRNSQKTFCGQPKEVMTDFFDSLTKWVENWQKETTERYLKGQGYCAHCSRKFIKEGEL